MPLGHRISPVRGVAGVAETRPFRASASVTRPIVTNPAPTSRAGEAKTLPRTYVARRRSSPKGIPAVSVPDDPPPLDPRTTSGERQPAVVARSAVFADHTAQASVPHAPLTLRQLMLILIATAAIAIAVSGIVSVIVGRSFLRPANVTSTR